MLSTSTSRRLFVYFGVVGALSLVPLSACLNPSLDEVEATERPAPLVESPALPPGTYPIQSIAYDDADGAYRVFLLDAPPSQRGAYVSTSLRMARLTDDEIAAGKSSFVDVDAEGPVAKLGMRNRQRRVRERLAVDPQHVDVECPRSPPFAAFAPEALFDRQCDIQEFASGQRSANAHRGVHVVGLRRTDRRFRFVGQRRRRRHFRRERR